MTHKHRPCAKFPLSQLRAGSSWHQKLHTDTAAPLQLAAQASLTCHKQDEALPCGPQAQAPQATPVAARTRCASSRLLRRRPTMYLLPAIMLKTSSLLALACTLAAQLLTQPLP